MEPDSQPSGAESREPASPEVLVSIASRKLAMAGTAVLAVLAVAAAVWGVQEWQTSRAIASVENSVNNRALPAAVPGNPAAAPAPAERPAEVVAAPATADRLPPLVLPGQSVPPAVLRDLPDWVAAEVAPGQAAVMSQASAGSRAPAPTPVQTSGASSDESASAAPLPAGARPQRERSEASPRKDRYGAVFARCPGPGESGAVECRRAVCDGAAKKSAACGPYLK